jgi:hypothetical protein
VPAACIYVVILEMGMIWGLYSRRAWLFWGTVAQLALFHYTSWAIVGFWYPTLMTCLISILPLARLLPPPQNAVMAIRARRRHAAGLAGAVALMFAAFQLVPRAFPGDTAVTGEGRMFALHMFDALIECEATMTHHLPEGDRVEVRAESKKFPHRSRCDPLVYHAIARNACARSPAADFDLSLRSKRNSSAGYTQVLDIRHFCATQPRYTLWRHNEWIGVPDDRDRPALARR